MATSDPVSSAIYDGVKRGINVCLENRCFGSAVILTYSGIDTMANLTMPQNQTDVGRDDFVNWCETYIRFPGQQQLTGLELYGARCAMLHTYGVDSRLSREGRCRKIGYMSRSVPEIRYAPSVDPDFVLVSIEALATAFFAGIDRFLVDLFADPDRAPTAEQRLQQLVVAFPLEPNS